VVPASVPGTVAGTHAYQYDALGRRVAKTTGGTTPSTTVYVSRSYGSRPNRMGRELAEYPLGTPAASPSAKYAYGAYVDDALLLVDRTVAGTVAAGTDERLYVHADRRASVTGLSNSAGAVVERYAYTPYGETSVCNAAGTVIPTGSAYGQLLGYTGRRLDPEVGTLHFRARNFHPTLGRFLTRDPLFYPDGPNAYAGWHGMRGRDPSGLDWFVAHDWVDWSEYERGTADYCRYFNPWSDAPRFPADNVLANGQIAAGGVAATAGALAGAVFVVGEAAIVTTIGFIVGEAVEEGIEHTTGIPVIIDPLDAAQAAGKKFGKKLLQCPPTTKPDIHSGPKCGTTPEPSVAPNAGPSPRTPVGRSGQQHSFPNPNAPQPRNVPTTINGRNYSGHAIDRMQERGFVPSVVENAIKTGTATLGNTPGTTVFTDLVNNLRVIVDTATGRVITVIPGI
jgi:RHS repeat-associated protein